MNVISIVPKITLNSDSNLKCKVFINSEIEQFVEIPSHYNLLPVQIQKTDKILAWLIAFYDTIPTLLLLDIPRYQSILQYIPKTKVDTLTVFNATNNYPFQLIIIKNCGWTTENLKILTNIKEPPPNLTVEEFELSVLEDSNLMDKLRKNAKSNNLTLMDLVHDEAKLLFDTQNSIYDIELLIRSSRNWLVELETRSKTNNLTIEEKITETAERLHFK